MADVTEFHTGGGYYTFPDGHRVRGRATAEEYAAALAASDADPPDEPDVQDGEDVDTRFRPGVPL